MDSLTHIILGAAIGEAVLGKKIGRKAMLWGAIADTIPDLDIFASPCFSHAQQLMVHRGITHSIFFVAVMSPLLGWIFSKWYENDNTTWKNWSWLFFWGLFSHIILDAFTCYGTGWFEPFNSYRVSFNSIFVADPFYTLPFLICVLIALIAKNGSPERIKWNKISLIISTAYLAFTIVNKQHVHDKMETSLNQQNIHTSDFVTTPTPLNNFLWMAYAKDTSGFWFGYYSVFDKTNKINYVHVNQNNLLIAPYKEDESVQLLKQFSKGYYCITNKNQDIYFNDIRFGQIGGWDKPTDEFVFSFKLKKDADNSMALDRSKFNGSYADAVASLITRIKGK
jgi:inner membrane protein